MTAIIGYLLLGAILGATPAWLITAAIAAKEMRRKGAEWAEERRQLFSLFDKVRAKLVMRERQRGGDAA